jgi:hypothetical protein
VSIEISTRVWKQSRQKGTHKLFLLCLADHANGDGYCYPGIERIAEWCSVNERQGRRISADLQADGEIMVKVGGGRYGTNEYIITAGMDSEELEKTVAKYFKVGKKDAYEMVQELLKKQYDATNKNPVLEDTPVIADQNPVMQDTNPVLEDTRTVINRQEPTLSKGGEPKAKEPEAKTPKQEALESLEKVFFQYGGTLSPPLIERFYAVVDGNPDHPTERFAHAKKKLEETRSFFKAIDAYREWTLPKPQSTYQRPKPGIGRASPPRAAPAGGLDYSKPITEADRKRQFDEIMAQRRANGMSVPGG